MRLACNRVVLRERCHHDGHHERGRSICRTCLDRNWSVAHSFESGIQHVLTTGKSKWLVHDLPPAVPSRSRPSTPAWFCLRLLPILGRAWLSDWQHRWYAYGQKFIRNPADHLIKRQLHRGQIRQAILPHPSRHHLCRATHPRR